MRQIELDKQERERRQRMAERDKLIKEREAELKRLEAEQAQKERQRELERRAIDQQKAMERIN